MHIIEHIVQIIPEKVRQRCHRTNTQNVNPLCFQDSIHRIRKHIPADQFTGLTEFFHIGMQYHGHNVLIAKAVIGYLYALDRRKTVQNHLPHGLLHAGVTVKAQIHR
ncbi:MAG: hypothetical protein IIV73_06835, partial [Bacteroidaceae bacterium]|nr:hypothetical protein [Bacteroidaceae bacterium]